MKKTVLFLVIAISLLTNFTSPITVLAEESFDIVSESQLAQTEYAHQYVIFIAGMTSKSSGKTGDELDKKFAQIEEVLRSEGYKNFIYFSYSAAVSKNQGGMRCKGWGEEACLGNSDIFSSIYLPPQYDKEDTLLSVREQAASLDWLIEQIVSYDDQAQISIIGFSLGGIIASYWGADPASLFVEHYVFVRDIITVGSPVGGIPLAGPCAADYQDKICDLIHTLFGDIVLAELQIPVDDAGLSIVDDLPGVLAETKPFSYTSIQSTYDYFVNDEGIDMLGWGNFYLGSGTNNWPPHTRFHDRPLGGIGLMDQPVDLIIIRRFIKENHTASVKSQLTAFLILDVLRDELSASPIGVPYDILISGETAELNMVVLNKGKTSWEGTDFSFSPSPNNEIEVLGSYPLPALVEPGDEVSWTVVVAEVSRGPVIQIEYQMMYKNQAFGVPVQGFIIILPEELADLEDKTRDIVEDWIVKGEKEIDKLLERVAQEIQQELEQQAENMINRILNRCLNPLGLLSLGVVTIYLKRKRIK